MPNAPVLWTTRRPGGRLARTNSLDLANRVVEASHHIATNADRVQRVLAAQGAGIRPTTHRCMASVRDTWSGILRRTPRCPAPSPAPDRQRTPSRSAGSRGSHDHVDGETAMGGEELEGRLSVSGWATFLRSRSRPPSPPTPSRPKPDRSRPVRPTAIEHATCRVPILGLLGGVGVGFGVVAHRA